MKKIIIFMSIFFITSQSGNCALSQQDINVFNIKENDAYLLLLDSSVKNINISNKDIVNINPVTSIENDKKQLFIEVNKTGVCDVLLTSDNAEYRLRFISGSFFRDEKTDLIRVDIPQNIKNEIQ
ncbi:MAG: hypothetical protein LUH05_05595 [Candidatus Gastranaerophilales bacterium]|nr:hypothetical protein [Candidatus Gastranaerophilales bacterium]